MDFKDINEIISYAVGKEKEAVEFYEELSRLETFNNQKNTFEEFAQEEKKHVALFENFGKDKSKIEGYKFEWIPDIKRSDYMVDITYEPGMHYTDILRLAMKREEKALKLYNDLAGKSDDADVIKLFKIIALEEAKHKSILEKIYDDFMATQGD